MSEKSFADACDCHVHVVGPTDKFPQAGHGPYVALPADVESLRALAEATGVSRFVIVQPSFYGVDNSCLFEALEKLGDCGRGVAVVNTGSASASVLENYGRRGVCALRLNFYSVASADVDRTMERSIKQALDILPRSWHVELIARAATLVAASPVIAQAQVPITIDHYGLPETEIASPTGRGLLELASLPNVWIKLSAPYRCGADPLATVPPSGWLRAFLEAAPDQCVWGSDWPHTPPRSDAPGESNLIPYRKIEYGRLFDDFVGALESAELARRILIENPARLYGFERREKR